MFSLYCTDFPIAKITYSIANMRIFMIVKTRNVSVGDRYEKKSHWAFAMCGCLDKVIGLLFMPLIVPMYPMCKL